MLLIWKSSHWKSLLSNHFPFGCCRFLSYFLFAIFTSTWHTDGAEMFNHEFIERRGGRKALLNWGWNRIMFALFESVCEGIRGEKVKRIRWTIEKKIEFHSIESSKFRVYWNFQTSFFLILLNSQHKNKQTRNSFFYWIK